MGEVKGSHTRYCKTAPGPLVRAASGCGGGSGVVKRPRPLRAGPGRALSLAGPPAAPLPRPGPAPHSPVGCGNSSGASVHSGEGRDAGSMAALTVAARRLRAAPALPEVRPLPFRFRKIRDDDFPCPEESPRQATRRACRWVLTQTGACVFSRSESEFKKNKNKNAAGASHPDPLFPCSMVGGKVVKALGLSWRNDCSSEGLPVSSKNCIYLVWLK